VPGLRLVSDPPYGTTNFQSFWMEVLPGFGTSRDGLLEQLAEAGISARRGIMAAHRQPAYRWGNSGGSLLHQTERLNDRTLILPVFHELDDEGLSRIISTIRAAAAGMRT
jgi:dTDP-4-amino-4,6-dideoxygalactose transaminase